MALTDFRACFMPYCLAQLQNGTWHILNREYRPLTIESKQLGRMVSEFDIEITKGVINKIVKVGGISIHTNEPSLYKLENARGVEALTDARYKIMIYLYYDGSNPVNKEHRERYFGILDILFSLKNNGFSY